MWDVSSTDHDAREHVLLWEIMQLTRLPPTNTSYRYILVHVKKISALNHRKERSVRTEVRSFRDGFSALTFSTRVKADDWHIPVPRPSRPSSGDRCYFQCLAFFDVSTIEFVLFFCFVIYRHRSSIDHISLVGDINGPLPER